MNAVDPRQNPIFLEEQQNYLLFYSRVTCLVTIVLMMLGIGLDLSFYPNHAGEFATARIIGCILIGGVLYSYQGEWGRRHAKQLTYFWICVSQAVISWMIFRTEGEQSIYFVGLTFALSGIAFFLPLSIVEAAGVGVFTLFAYTLACSLRPGGMQSIGAWFGSSIFIGFYIFIAMAIAVYSGRWRWLSFQLKQEIIEKNNDLQKVNQALAEIKGHMMQQEKMAALGTLAAGLLHEVNNPVNYSLMALNMAQMDAAPLGSDMLKESLADAKEGMQRVQGIVSDLKTFAYQKPGDDASRIFLFEKALKSALRLTGFELKGVEVSTDLPMDSHVHGDEPAVIGVLINLLGNAALALHKSGRKTPKISVHAQRVDARLQVAVRDNGTGITPENLLRVFEPFFTTREVGKGLGLGLSVSYAIINRHGGELRVASAPGEWTEFTFDLRLANLNA